MRKLLPAMVVLLLMISCRKQEANPNELNATDKSFLLKMAMANNNEIVADQLALGKSNNAGVISFARAAIRTYSLAQADIEHIANQFNFDLPASGFFSNLGDLSGYEFDTAFINGRVRSQEIMLGLFQNEMNEGNNPSVRFYYPNRYMDTVVSYYLKADSISRVL